MGFVKDVKVIWDSAANQVVQVFPEGWDELKDDDGKSVDAVEVALQRLAGVRPEGAVNLYAGVLTLDESDDQKSDRERLECEQKEALKTETPVEEKSSKTESKTSKSPC